MKFLHVDYCSEIGKNTHFIKLYLAGSKEELAILTNNLKLQFEKTKKIKIDYALSSFTFYFEKHNQPRHDTSLMLDLIVKCKHPVAALDLVCLITKKCIQEYIATTELFDKVFN